MKRGAVMKKIYDFIVIGAGPAGLMIAKELSAAGQDVLLIDIKRNIKGFIVPVVPC